MSNNKTRSAQKSEKARFVILKLSYNCTKLILHNFYGIFELSQRHQFFETSSTNKVVEVNVFLPMWELLNNDVLHKKPHSFNNFIQSGMSILRFIDNLAERNKAGAIEASLKLYYEH